VPSEWAATPLVLSFGTVDHAAHIIQGDIVRVVRGREQHRTGRVTAKLSHGAALSLSDLITKQIVRFLTSTFSL
jgi:hypothetical protein